MIKKDITDFYNKVQEKIYFIVDRFELAYGTSFPHIWYCNMYMHHIIIFTNYCDMFLKCPKKYTYDVNKAFKTSLKHRNSNYYQPEQIRKNQLRLKFSM
jgi:hypothetical protein